MKSQELKKIIDLDRDWGEIVEWSGLSKAEGLEKLDKKIFLSWFFNEECIGNDTKSGLPLSIKKRHLIVLNFGQSKKNWLIAE